MMMRAGKIWLVMLAAVLMAGLSRARADETAELTRKLMPWAQLLSGGVERFGVDATVQFDRQTAQVQLRRWDAQTMAVELKQDQFPFRLIRTAGRTVLVLPAHRTAIVAEGDVGGVDTLAPGGLMDRLIGPDTMVQPYFQLLSGNSEAMISLLAGEYLSKRQKLGVALEADADHLLLSRGQDKVEIRRVELGMDEQPGEIPQGYSIQKVDRTEMETLIVRGVRRGLEVLAPSMTLKNPARKPAKVAHGELRWVEDQRLILLGGTPEQIGTAQGQLIPVEMKKCRDSVLGIVGVASTLNEGRWFLDSLRDAWGRLEKHIPADEIAEMDAAADAAGMDREQMRLANVFPELFHCSGFAVMGKATVDGKLYHGRVLDYMTMIGLQDAAVTFVVSPSGRHTFISAGYAGFMGVVSGMNDQQVSLGEMGGRGEGNWDGVPMATLMRRALEECSTLEQVKHLWSSSPRTCEYYYVFSDGKIPDAVGVAATPEKIEFIEKGASHPELGPGIADTVLMSASDRLQTLRNRVMEGYGKLDAAGAMGLMARPVAMKSNLHDVLFVPQDGVVYIANADHERPAADRGYVKYDFMQLARESKMLDNQ
ncbi:MAG: hypothetical protein IT446_15085 [Phycisphaerales bacterium]|nr:hypothetical protein [Phycisphaerales bacterium]